jgi:hypothetical protein
MRQSKSARLAAGALFLVAAVSSGQSRIEIASPMSGGCPAAGPPWGLETVGVSDLAIGAGCVAVFRPVDLSDAAIEAAESQLARSAGIPGLLLDFSALRPGPPDSERFAFVVKRLASAARSTAPAVRVAVDVSPEQNRSLDASFWTETDSYREAVVWRAGRGPVATGEVTSRYWLAVDDPGGADAASALFQAIAALPAGTRFERILIGTAADAEELARLQKYFVENVAPEPPTAKAAAADGRAIPLVEALDPKELTPLLFLPRDPAGTARIELPSGNFAKASVENLTTGARRDFDLAGGRTLALDLSKGPLAVALRRAAGAGAATREQVRVGGERKLTAEEIVAKERAWDAGQRERVKTFIAGMKTSLRFRIAEVNETFDLTIEGELFFERGKSPDWAWHQFYLNGVKWKGRELPKLPILQPEKVTTLPLDIQLTEDYAYVLKGETTISGRLAYEIAFTPKASIGDKPVYHGTAYIDAETFGLLRRDSVQENLKGETLSNVQSEFYSSVPGRPDVILPLRIKGQQVFSTAGRTTSIERDVTMDPVEIDPPTFSERLAAAYASPQQMIRDTPNGLRYLLPDPEHPGGRIVQERVSRKSTFGLVGGFYDGSLDYPIPLLGVQHFDFDLWEKGKQISIFFAGALLTANYTDPALGGSRFDLGADLFAVAFASTEVNYKEGKEVPGENIKHLPAFFSVNVGHPLGPYLKASVGLFTNWNNYHRDDETAPEFVTPADTFSNGALVKLVANYKGFSATLAGSYENRVKWPFWGLPGNPDYSPAKKDYWKYSLELNKDQYFKGFRKLHVGIAYRGGVDLDRFSKFEFGTFSGHPIRGYKNGSLRSEKALTMNLSYGLNIENIIRFEGFYDQAILNDEESGFHNTYFSGAGLLASLNGPFKNSLIRGEVGVPVVGHGNHGVVVQVLILKLF